MTRSIEEDGDLRHTCTRAMGKNVGQSSDRMKGEIYFTGRRFTARRCVVQVVHVSTCSRAWDIQAGRRRRFMTHSSYIKRYLSGLLLSTQQSRRRRINSNVTAVRRTGNAAVRITSSKDEGVAQI